MSIDNSSATDGFDPRPLARRFVAEAMPLHPELLRAACRYAATTQDADDLVQDTYVRAWTGFATFHQGSNLRAWMFRILVNTWISTHRRTQSRPNEILVDDIPEAHLSSYDSAEAEMLSHMVDDDLRAAVQTLPPNLQAVVYYVYVCELPFGTIAELTDVPVGTVMSRAHRARSTLRATLSDRRPCEITTDGVERRCPHPVRTPDTTGHR